MNRSAKGRTRTLPDSRCFASPRFNVGTDKGEPVIEAYHMPFDFPGKLEKVDVKLEL